MKTYKFEIPVETGELRESLTGHQNFEQIEQAVEELGEKISKQDLNLDQAEVLRLNLLREFGVEVSNKELFSGANSFLKNVRQDLQREVAHRMLFGKSSDSQEGD